MMTNFYRFLFSALIMFIIGLPFGRCAYGQAQNDIVPIIDHHQHLFSPELSDLISEPDSPLKPITASDLILKLDKAGIKRAVVLSTAYIYSQPGRDVENEYEKVKAENNWTSRQVASFPKRLIGFCSVNPLKDYALKEIERCAEDPHLNTGLKLHFANAEVNYHDPEHINKIRRVFQAANIKGMALVIHMRASLSPKLPYGREEALVFLNKLVPAAPDVPIQIAHLAGSGTYTSDPLVDPALSVFIEAITKDDPGTEQLWFDVTSAASKDMSEEEAAFLAKRIQQLGIERIVYGSDAAVPGNSPSNGWEAFRSLPLTKDEFRTIANNIAPYITNTD